MPYANNNGVKIYYEVEGEGPPLVLAHALGGVGMHMWRRDNYTEALRNDFQLVLFDFRGHGLSDKPHETSACDIRILATDVLKILDNLGINTTHYWGYSLGSRVGFWLATHHAERFQSFILAAMTPYAIPESTIKQAEDIIEGLKVLKDDPEAYQQLLESRFRRSLTPEEKKRFMDQDADAIIAMWMAWLNSSPMTDKDLATISQPCLVSCGELDEGGFHQGASECVNHMLNAKFISLSGLNHGTAFSRSDLVLPHIKDFLAEVGKK